MRGIVQFGRLYHIGFAIKQEITVPARKLPPDAAWDDTEKQASTTAMIRMIRVFTSK